MVFAGFGVVERFQGGSGGAEQNGTLFQMGTEHGEVTSVVAWGAVLFVGVLVLFIDDNDAEVGEGREDGTARADDDARFALADTVPFIEALALGEVGVQHGDLLLDGGKA